MYGVGFGIETVNLVLSCDVVCLLQAYAVNVNAAFNYNRTGLFLFSTVKGAEKRKLVPYFCDRRCKRSNYHVGLCATVANVSLPPRLQEVRWPTWEPT